MRSLVSFVENLHFMGWAQGPTIRGACSHIGSWIVVFCIYMGFYAYTAGVRLLCVNQHNLYKWHVPPLKEKKNDAEFLISYVLCRKLIFYGLDSGAHYSWPMLPHWVMSSVENSPFMDWVSGPTTRGACSRIGSWVVVFMCLYGILPLYNENWVVVCVLIWDSASV